jgi:hypothetical protein
LGWREKYTRFWWEIPKERVYSEGGGVDGRVGSEWILGKLAGGCGVDSIGSGYGPVIGCCVFGDETSGSGAMELVILFEIVEVCVGITISRLQC